VAVGTVLDGKYRIEGFLGKGAMGYVVQATQMALDRVVAIKFLLRANDADAELRFLREARIAGRLKSQHAAKVLDVGVHDGAPFIVMEYLDGEDLAARIERAGALGVQDAVGYVLQACEALAEAHSAGIVHRDIKPANLMLTTGAGGAPCIKVLDFGVSKAVGQLGLAGTEEVRLTATSQSIGSPLYMAPEQINDAAHVDGRADVWSLGVVLYQLLTETTPWTGDTLLALFSSMASNAATPISEYRPDVPPGLTAIIEQCLQKDRARRWPGVAEFAAALAPFASASMAGYSERLGSRGSAQVPPARPTVELPAPDLRAAQRGAPLTTSDGAHASVARTASPDAQPPRQRGAVVALSVLLAMALFAAAAFAWRGRVGAPAATADSAPAAVSEAPPPVVPPSPPVSAQSSAAPTSDPTAAPAASGAVAPRSTVRPDPASARGSKTPARSAPTLAPSYAPKLSDPPEGPRR
jgi:serine/threonine-protein kinase